jgi:hypothetical protein
MYLIYGWEFEQKEIFKMRIIPRRSFLDDLNGEDIDFNFKEDK